MANELTPQEMTSAARRELGVMSQIVDALEPLSHEKREQVLAAAMCLTDMEVARAAIRYFRSRL